MAEATEVEVNDEKTEPVADEADEGGETVEEETDSSQSADEGDEEAEAESEPVKKPVTEPKVEKVELKEAEGETPRERALRLEITRLRREKHGEQTKELMQAPQVQEAPKTENTILSKYKPEEIQSLREVLPALAQEMGYVRQADLQQSAFQDTLNDFLEANPSYSATNDPEGVMWSAFKAEYGLYQPPKSTKELKKILDRVNKEVMGIQATGPTIKSDAAKEKVKAASHTGPSAPARRQEGLVKRGTQGVRLDMLKGFSEEEKSRLAAE